MTPPEVLYLTAVAAHAAALALGMLVLGRFGDYFRTRRSVLSEARYLTVAVSTVGNLFLGTALALYLRAGLNQPARLELVFALGHLLTAAGPVVWHGLTYAELRREERDGR